MKNAFLFAIAIALAATAASARELRGQTAPGPAYSEASRENLLRAVMDIVDSGVLYDPTYVRLPYPMGDVPPEIGVCTDVVIRAYRRVGIDLQARVHRDMRANFGKYPSNRIWGLKGPDPNIDHRRVPNLMTYFSRHGKVLKITDDHQDYKPGAIVCWELGPGGRLHIGMVSDQPVNGANADDGYLLIHNIGGGQILEDCLFRWRVIGHYYYLPPTPPSTPPPPPQTSPTR